jgi:hypothetical protein
MDWRQEPSWLRALSPEKTKKALVAILAARGLRKTFMDRQEIDHYIHTVLRWPWRLQWRSEQEAAIDAFFSTASREVVIQAVFGSGKTTMMLAMIHTLLVKNYCEASQIVVFAFNVAIKNEIRKRLQNPGIGIRTYDSLIYTLCAEMDMDLLHLPNFEGKRRFVRDRVEAITPCRNVRYVFVDEAQDLEKPCHEILRARFPDARFLFVGDIFQSIQKEPRESLLWSLLQTPDPERTIFHMRTTPRVPPPILHEIRGALSTFYPEFKQTIEEWSSSNDISTTARIEWRGFDSYKKVYDDMLAFCAAHPHKDIMILTFSSAITVRGTLGDVARVRKFLHTHGIETNSNHKNMLHDRIFLSTANSSKGLERAHVFCFLTFPLEKAFSNFSDDLVVNIVTVALSRAKESVVMYVPSHNDRFSEVLRLYKDCPKPNLTADPPPFAAKKRPQAADHFHQNTADMRTMLEQEHGATELLRQNILSFETKTALKNLAKRYQMTPIPPTRVESFRSEEGCTFVGLLFESLILTTWTHSWPKITPDVHQHEVFAHFSPQIEKYKKAYLAMTRRPVTSVPPRTVLSGCVLFARLQLACYQKIFIHVSAREEEMIWAKWSVLLPVVPSLRPDCPFDQLRTQSNLTMPFVTGIADALVVADPLEVIEIKASRASDWCTNALIQSILYGLMLGKNYFRVHLINVYQSHRKSYSINTERCVQEMRKMVASDVALWNLNCFLAKNVTHNDPEKPTLHTDGLFLIDGRPDIGMYTLGEMLSPTRFYILLRDVEECEVVERLAGYVRSGRAKHLITARHVDGRFDRAGIPTTHLRFPANQFRQAPEDQWITFMRNEIVWSEKTDDHKTRLDWTETQSTLSVQICDLCVKNNFL